MKDQASHPNTHAGLALRHSRRAIAVTEVLTALGCPTTSQPPPRLICYPPRQESPCPGKKVPGERPERLQMLSLNHAPNNDLQSPLDAFAAKHCPMRSRKSTEGHSRRDSAEGIPEVDFDLDGDYPCSSQDNTSPLSTLMKRQFPQKGASERRLFE